MTAKFPITFWKNKTEHSVKISLSTIHPFFKILKEFAEELL